MVGLELKAGRDYTSATMNRSDARKKLWHRFAVATAALVMLVGLGAGCAQPAEPAAEVEEDTMKENDEVHEESSSQLNRLQYETSPYLLMHADNPVDWYPWSDEAFQAAREQNKPIFLSIGYASCHWCHVMEEESFSHHSVADVLNESYISIKVDKEERPDVDQAYMAISQVITGQAGWPLTVLMTPEGEPFYLATYMPRESSAGQLGLLELLERIVDEFWNNDYQEGQLRQSGESFVKVTQSVITPEAGESFPEDAHDRATQELKTIFDTTNGGFGTAPKFPVPTYLSYLLREYYSSGDQALLDMVLNTLDKMRAGGVYDHVGAGFHRYAVDATWSIPHFEKMLYDQALLTEVYLDAYALTGRAEYAATAKDILGYVTTILSSPEGGFYGAQDADIDGVEGVFYVWSLSEMADVLSEGELRVLTTAAELPTSAAAMDEDAHYVLSLTSDVEDVAVETGFTVSDVRGMLASALGKLAERRETRVAPNVDDKVATDWNGLAIAALSRAGRVLDDPSLVDAATRAADFIWNSMRTADGRLLHTYRDGKASVDGLLEDYAFLTYGLIELYQATQNLEHLERAIELSDQTLELFWDVEEGGFFQVATEADQLVLRLKPVHDGALPSGNAVAGENLVRLGILTSNSEMLNMADQTFAAFGPLMENTPSQYSSLLGGRRLAMGNAYIAIVVGQPGDSALKSLRDAVDTSYAPATVLVVLEGDVGHEEASEIIPAAIGHTTLNGEAVAYVCDRQLCALPITDAEALRSMITSQ